MGNSIYHPVQSQPLITGEYKKTASRLLQGNQAGFAAQFQSVMQSNESLAISKHAKQRLEQRGININQARWEQIGEKVMEAKRMGVKESLVLLEDVALIVSTKNNTVITAMDRNEATTQIFTNINGTILID